MIFASTMDLMSWNATFWKLDATSMILAVSSPSRDLRRAGCVGLRQRVGGQRVEKRKERMVYEAVEWR